MLSADALGAALGRRRKEAVIVTKTLVRKRTDAARAVEQSLRRLRTDYVDVYLCHDCTDRAEYEKAVGPRGSLEALPKARRAGKVRFIGISAHDLGVLADAMRSGAFEIVELEYSANNPAASRRLLPLASRLDNALKGRHFGSLADENRQLLISEKEMDSRVSVLP